MKCEHVIPTAVGDLVKAKAAKVKIMASTDKWFGVTYGEDKYAVKEAFLKLQADGVYLCIARLIYLFANPPISLCTINKIIININKPPIINKKIYFSNSFILSPEYIIP